MRTSDLTRLDLSTNGFEGMKGRLTHPMAVVRDATMTTDEKRSMLASWASDQRAVRDAPSLRRLDNGCLIEIDDILAALQRLDEPAGRPNPAATSKRPYRRERWPGVGRLRRRDRGDDDDGPPTPTPAAIRPRPPVLEGGAAVAV